MKTLNATLILVLGMPATGKTYLSKKIASKLALPVISKDDIKDIIFDGLGSSDREYSKKVGRTSFTILDYFLKSQLAVGNSLIFESPLSPEYENEKFRKWQQKYNFKVVQILCWAEGETLIGRFIERSHSGTRHLGHADVVSLEEFRADLLKGKAKPLDLDSKIIEVDTTDFNLVDYSSVCDQVRQIT